MKTRKQINDLVKKLQGEINDLKKGEGRFASGSIAESEESISHFNNILNLKGDLEDHKRHLDRHYMNGEMIESDAYGWVLGHSDSFDDIHL